SKSPERNSTWASTGSWGSPDEWSAPAPAVPRRCSRRCTRPTPTTARSSSCTAADVDEAYLEAVLDLVAEVPPGRVMTYGSIAEVLVDSLGRGGPRQVGQVLARAGSDVPWWRVVNAAGRPPAHKRDLALRLLADEGCPFTPGRD